MEQVAGLRELVGCRGVPADIATRGRIVPWSGEERRRKDIAELLGVSLPTVDRWKRRYAEHGLAGWKVTGLAGPGSKCRHGYEPG
ncbi:helix-turn-helix domain-containing protein [Streptomyces celluloflavus]|uniref:helix-turn-helix domain-containing protein n=1 Tax=Streptomyces celluloflavus TaxID=58344 RepID=UPI0036B1F790